MEIRWSDTEGAENPLMPFWKHSDAILCCSEGQLVKFLLLS